MSNINRVQLMGNLGAEPSYFSGQSGADAQNAQNPAGGKFCRFSVATNESWLDRNTNEWKSRTEWHNVVVFNSRLVNVCTALTKGSPVYVEGSIHYSVYTDRNGVNQKSVSITADVVAPLTRVQSENSGDFNGAARGNANYGGNNGYNQYGNNQPNNYGNNNYGAASFPSPASTGSYNAPNNFNGAGQAPNNFGFNQAPNSFGQPATNGFNNPAPSTFGSLSSNDSFGGQRAGGFNAGGEGYASKLGAASPATNSFADSAASAPAKNNAAVDSDEQAEPLHDQQIPF